MQIMKTENSVKKGLSELLSSPIKGEKEFSRSRMVDRENKHRSPTGETTVHAWKT